MQLCERRRRSTRRLFYVLIAHTHGLCDTAVFLSPDALLPMLSSRRLADCRISSEGVHNPDFAPAGSCFLLQVNRNLLSDIHDPAEDHGCLTGWLFVFNQPTIHSTKTPSSPGTQNTKKARIIGPFLQFCFRCFLQIAGLLPVRALVPLESRVAISKVVVCSVARLVVR